MQITVTHVADWKSNDIEVGYATNQHSLKIAGYHACITKIGKRYVFFVFAPRLGMPSVKIADSYTTDYTRAQRRCEAIIAAHAAEFPGYAVVNEG